MARILFTKKVKKSNVAKGNRTVKQTINFKNVVIKISLTHITIQRRLIQEQSLRPEVSQKWPIQSTFPQTTRQLISLPQDGC